MDEERKYEKRWIAETAFSSLKRVYGEYVSATRFQNMVKEMALKVSLHSLLGRLSQPLKKNVCDQLVMQQSNWYAKSHESNNYKTNIFYICQLVKVC